MMKNILRFIFAVFTNKNVSKYFVIPWPLIDIYCKEKSNDETQQHTSAKNNYCNKHILKSKNYRARATTRITISYIMNNTTIIMSSTTNIKMFTLYCRIPFTI